MEVDVIRFRKCLAFVVCAIVASLLAVTPARAGGVQGIPGINEATGAARPSTLTTLSAATRGLLLQPTRASSEQTQTSGNEAQAFFKTKKGAAVLVLVAVGFGYTLYSKNHDRVSSPVR